VGHTKNKNRCCFRKTIVYVATHLILHVPARMLPGCTQEKEAEEEEEEVVAVSVEDLVEIIYMNLLRNYTRHDS
jgi:hypothetical protein